MSLEQVLRDIANSARSLKASQLSDLSGLSGDEEQAFKDFWPTIRAERRRKIVDCLVDLAEDNVELDFDAVFLTCLDDQDAHVRATAIRGLWEYEGSSLIPHLARLLSDDVDTGVRSQAATALGRYALMAELGHLRSEDAKVVEKALKSAIDDQTESAEVKARAVESAAALSQPWVKESIEWAYYSGNQRLKVSAVHAMGVTCDPSWLPILLEELDSEDPELRYEAAGACGSLGLEEAVPRLILLLEDEDAEVQAEAVAALGEIGSQEAKEELLAKLKDRRPWMREAARQALAELDFNEDPLAFRYRE